MSRILSPQVAARRNELAALLLNLRSICRSGLSSDSILDRLKLALAEAGNIGRMVKIVPRPGCTAAGTKLSFVIDNEMVIGTEGYEAYLAPLQRIHLQNWKNSRDYQTMRSPKLLGLRGVAFFEVDGCDLICQGAD